MGRIFFRFPALVSIICHLLSLPKLGISFAATPFTRKPRDGSVNKTGLGLAAYGFRTTGNRRDTYPPRCGRLLIGSALAMEGYLYSNA